MLRSVVEVLIRAQQNQIVPDTKLCDKCVDRSNLHARSAAQVPEVGRGNMILTIWLDQGERREGLDNLLACLRVREALQEFLQDQARGHDHPCPGQGFLEHVDLMPVNFGIAPEGERPDARIDQERHLRERSTL